jgi:hypothetical protein
MSTAVIGYSRDAAQILVIAITDSGEADHGSERRNWCDGEQ